MKSDDDWKCQHEHLAWKVSIRDGVPLDEAKVRVTERAIRIGQSRANRKFYRMICKAMKRRGLTFREAAALVWDRVTALVLIRFMGHLGAKLESIEQ